MTEISRIEVFCEDKLVGRIQRALAGLGVLNVKSMPVANAKADKNGKVKAESSGDLLEMLVVWLRDKKLKTVTPKDLQQFAVSAGRAATSYSVVLARAIAAKILKKSKGTGGKTVRYDVLRGVK